MYIDTCLVSTPVSKLCTVPCPELLCLTIGLVSESGTLT